MNDTDTTITVEHVGIGFAPMLHIGVHSDHHLGVTFDYAGEGPETELLLWCYECDECVVYLTR